MEIDWYTNLGRYSNGMTTEERVARAKAGIRTPAIVVVFGANGERLFSGTQAEIMVRCKGLNQKRLHYLVNTGKLWHGKYYFDYEL